MTTPVIPTVIAFVPGTTASELNSLDGETQIWPAILDPDSMGVIAYGKAVAAFETLDGLPIGDIVSTITLPGGTLPCYASLLEYVTTAANFTDNVPFTVFSYSTANESAAIPVQDRLFFTIPYDWRLGDSDGNDIEGGPRSAQRLQTALNALDSAFAQAKSGYNLYLVTHSMGGLITRFVLESVGNGGGQNPWIANTKALITLGTPHSGAPLALSAILGQQVLPSETTLEEIFIKATVNNILFPSTYQLLPQPGQNFIAYSGSSYDLDTAPSAVAAALQSGGFKPGTWSGSAVPFFQALDPAKATIPYHAFYGEQLGTVTGFTYASNSFTPDKGDGDGIVPTTSGDFSAWTYADVTTQGFSGYTHGQLGGSDMSTAPNAILAALTVAGIPVQTPAAAKTLVGA